MMIQQEILLQVYQDQGQDLLRKERINKGKKVVQNKPPKKIKRNRNNSLKGKANKQEEGEVIAILQAVNLIVILMKMMDLIMKINLITKEKGGKMTFLMMRMMTLKKMKKLDL